MSDNTSVRDQIVASAKTVPDLIKFAETADPQLAAMLTGKSLAGSWSVWVALLTPGVTWAATHYGLGWDKATCGEVATILTSLAAILMRYVTHVPITSVLPSARGG